MDESNIVEFAGRDALSDPLTNLLRKGARELLQSAVEAELEAFMAQFRDQQTPDGHAAVVRNGHHPERACNPASALSRCRWRRCARRRASRSRSIRRWSRPNVRKAKSLEAALPWLYLKGISTGEMDGALKALLRPDATGFSANTRGAAQGEMGSLIR